MPIYTLPKRLKETPDVTLGEKIKALRKRKKLSQGELATVAEINANHLSRLERGMFQPSVDVLRRLAATLEVTVDYLLSEEDGDTTEVHLANKTLAEQLRLIAQLDPDDQAALVRIIDSMLTKHRMHQLLETPPQIASSG
jgi:transcriptional regulator with XRE-family HTH domain